MAGKRGVQSTVEPSRFEEQPELGRVDVVLLSAILEARAPVGARLAARLLRDKGPDLSEATVSRSFARLDSLGLTVPLGRKGRVLTEAGRRYVQGRIERDRRDAQFDRAFDLRTIEEILDWLKARQLLESQAARLAALRATKKQIKELEASLKGLVGELAQGGDPTPVGLHFHEIIVQACGSPIFTALISSLYGPALVNVERALDVILRTRGTMAESAADHERILEALKNKDPDAAGQAMSKHLARLQTEAQRFEDEASAGGFEKTLRLIEAARSPY